MNFGIEVNFFESEKPDLEIDGRLFINENGKDYLEFSGGLFEYFRPINLIYARAKYSEERYTLVNCCFVKSISNNIRFQCNWQLTLQRFS